MSNANSNSVQYGFGQYGSIHVRGTNDVTCGLGNRVFVAIQFLEDSKFDNGATGLVPADAQLFPSSTGVSSDIDPDGGVATDDELFSKGITIYGRWTGFKLSSGGCIAYIGA
jgi:hypothetical protein